MVRSAEWKLVSYTESDEGELYRLSEDPGEHVNLWNDVRYDSEKRRLLCVHQDWLVGSHLQTRTRQAPWR